MLRLILSNLQHFKSNDNKNVYTGPSSFIGKNTYDFFLNYKHSKLTFNTNNHLNDSNHMILVSENILDALTLKFNNIYNCNFDKDYWRVLFSTSLISTVQTFFEKKKNN